MNKLVYRETEDLTALMGKDSVEEIFVYPGLGEIRYEILPEMMFMHPTLQKTTISGFKELKKLIYSTGREIAEKYYFDRLFIWTNNNKFLKMLCDNYHFVDVIDGIDLHCIIIEEVASCQQ